MARTSSNAGNCSNIVVSTLSDGSLLVELLWRLDLWASMRSFNGDFPPWRCSGRQRRRGKRRRHPLGNKPLKKEFHHQDEPWIRSLERMLQWRKRKRERKREGGARNWRKKKGEKLNFELCLWTRCQQAHLPLDEPAVSGWQRCRWQC